jgi:hypothetical protein
VFKVLLKLIVVGVTIGIKANVWISLGFIIETIYFKG